MTREQKQLIDDIAGVIYGDHMMAEAGDVLYALEFLRYEITEAVIIVSQLKTQH